MPPMAAALAPITNWNGRTVVGGAECPKERWDSDTRTFWADVSRLSSHLSVPAVLELVGEVLVAR